MPLWGLLVVPLAPGSHRSCGSWPLGAELSTGSRAEPPAHVSFQLWVWALVRAPKGSVSPGDHSLPVSCHEEQQQELQGKQCLSPA